MLWIVYYTFLESFQETEWIKHTKTTLMLKSSWLETKLIPKFLMSLITLSLAKSIYQLSITRFRLVTFTFLLTTKDCLRSFWLQTKESSPETSSKSKWTCTGSELIELASMMTSILSWPTEIKFTLMNGIIWTHQNSFKSMDSCLDLMLSNLCVILNSSLSQPELKSTSKFKESIGYSVNKQYLTLMHSMYLKLLNMDQP